MNSRIFLLPVIGVSTFFILLFTFTKIFGPIPFSVNSVTTSKTETFQVSGDGKIEASPDMAVVNGGVYATGLTVKETQSQLNENINKVSEELKKLGLDAKDIQSTNYSINPDTDYRQLKQRITGYSASTNLQIKIRDIEKTNQVIDKMTENGVNQIGGISSEIADKTKLINLARIKAVADAKAKAENAARIAGFKIGRIINYSESLGDSPPTLRSLEVSQKDSTAATKIEPGQTSVNVTVTLSYEII